MSVRYGSSNEWKFKNTWKLSNRVIEDLDFDGIYSEKFAVPSIAGMHYQFKLVFYDGVDDVVLTIITYYGHKIQVRNTYTVTINDIAVHECNRVHEGIAKFEDTVSITPYVPITADGEYMYVDVEGKFSLLTLRVTFCEASSGMQILWQQKNDKDLILMCGDKEIMTNRWLLEHHSSFFKNNVDSIPSKYVIDGFNYNVVLTAVKYYYQLNVTHYFKEKEVGIMDCLRFAFKYGMNEFKKYVEALCLDHINNQSVVEMANEAKKLECDVLEELCLTFLVSKAGKGSIPDSDKLDDDICTEIGRRLLSAVTRSSKVIKPSEASNSFRF